MLKTRLILLAACVVVIVILFQLPKAVVENEGDVAQTETDTVQSHLENHVQVPAEVSARITQFRRLFNEESQKEKNAIFADSLATLYTNVNVFDSAAWFAEEASKVYNNPKSWAKAGDSYYQAYTLAIDEDKQKRYATKAQEFYKKVLDREPKNFDVKTRMAMTYLTTASPMEGITLLREVLAEDPTNELALFNMGMLSIQSGQYDRAVDRLQDLLKVNPVHLQGNLLLGVAWMNLGRKDQARAQFEKVKTMDQDPAVQATVDSYLKDLK